MSQGYESDAERNPYEAPLGGFGGTNTTAAGAGSVTAKTVENSFGRNERSVGIAFNIVGL